MDALVEQLRAGGSVFAEDEARLLRERATGVELEELVRRRVGGEPLEHVLGYVDFMDRRYTVTVGVFVPRQRSVLLVEEAVRRTTSLSHPPVVVDLCCGTGALGLAVQQRCGGELYAVDLEPAAVACARHNGVEHVFAGDLFSPLPDQLRGRVDLVVANAPYVPTDALAGLPREARDHEPPLALDGGTDGLAVQRRLLAAAPGWLRVGGHLLTETSGAQVEKLAAEVRRAGLASDVARDEERGATVMAATVTGRRLETGMDAGVKQVE